MMVKAFSDAYSAALWIDDRLSFAAAILALLFVPRLRASGPRPTSPSPFGIKKEK